MKQMMMPERSVFQAGSLITFRLELKNAPPGAGRLRTTIGNAAALRCEMIDWTEKGRALEGAAWHDLPMPAVADGVFELTLPLLEVGVFEAKCCFVPADGSAILWPGGGNFRIKVESAANVAGNTIYCAFVRQFGPDCAAPHAVPCARETLEALDRAGYTVIPPSGTFRALIGRLDHIFQDLGCRILQLLPIHPAPTVYGRMGRYGSPFATLDYFAVDPALAEFDRNATVLEQFVELLDAVHARRGRIFLDIPVNHTGWGARLQNEHPEYFVRHPDGRFESPGAWGVVWEDLCRLNYAEPEVHRLMAEVFLYWCRIGVDGFRCDAGYMLPQAAWQYIVSRVRQEYPDTVFLLEGLGGRLEVQEKLLGEAGLDWAYSELFQNYTRDEITRYLPYTEQCAKRFGTLVNFAETHDNERLASKSRGYAAMRCALTALLAENGAFGFANGVEFFASERIDVHGAGTLDWGRSPNLVSWLRHLTTLLAVHPAFAAGSRVRLIQRGPGNLVVGYREASTGESVLVLANLDCERTARAHWPVAICGDPCGGDWMDLLSGERLTLEREGEEAVWPLAPGECRCLSREKTDWDKVAAGLSSQGEPAVVLTQRAAQLGYRIRHFFRTDPLAGGAPAESLRRNPYEFAAAAAGSDLSGVVRFRIGRDERRLVMVCPGELLLLEGEEPFRVLLTDGRRTWDRADSLPLADGKGEFAFLFPPEAPETARELTVELVVYQNERTARRVCGRILQLPPGEEVRWRFRFSGNAVRSEDVCAFAANRRGGMTLMRAAWGKLESKYDAVLAANGKSPYPVDRRVMFSRCRAWLVSEDYSQEIDAAALTGFSGGDNRAEWRFNIPSGQGRMTALRIVMEGAWDRDAVRLIFRRPPESAGMETVPPVTLILRPDLEDRPNHQVTKAFTGPETRFPAAVAPMTDGFRFAPEPGRALLLQVPGANYVTEPEWHYMVNLSQEEYYGLEHQTDLFSPGYFRFTLAAGESRTLFAAVTEEDETAISESSCRWPDGDSVDDEPRTPRTALREALRPFVVRRDDLHTVIAGYPWFLDWGRDTLIALRGLIRGGWRKEAREILRQFASFEEGGTIPNVIHGGEVGNRDTSDAPLWLFTAVRDYVDCFNDQEFLAADCGGRTLFQVLESIIAHYRTGTANGIGVDPASGLVFSPSHFTWMDTNFPAGTPREGYPIEIQALWIAALRFLGRRNPGYLAEAKQAEDALERLFFRSDLNRFADCLHASAGTAAAAAVPDDHVRPNQLLALTLGAVTVRERQLAILESAAELLVPGAIRSLSDRPVTYLLPVVRDGQLLNDPAHPYRGVYCGPEDTSRKVSYHNGTAWGWLFPSYCEGLYLVGGEMVRHRALALLGGSVYAADRGIPGMLPEVMDGDFPHRSGGCPAQAWSVTEAFRVYDLLQKA